MNTKKCPAQTSATISQKQLVIKLRQLALKPDTCMELVKNAHCLQTLIQTLKTPDLETVYICVQTLYIISNTPIYKPIILAIDPSFLTGLNLLRDSPHRQLSYLSNKLYKNLKSSTQAFVPSSQVLHYKAKKENTSKDFQAKNPIQKKWELANPSELNGSHSIIKSLLKKTKKQLIALQIQIPNLTEFNFEHLKKQVIYIYPKIVASITFESEKKNATFYCNNSPIEFKKTLSQFLRNIGFNCSVEGKKRNELKQTSNNQIRRYCEQKSNNKNMLTLEERISLHKKEKKKKKKAANSWLSSATSWFS